MSLYYDAVSILSNPGLGGSLKSRVYSHDAKLKSKPSQVYALVVETAKYDKFIKEVVDNAGLLTLEPKLTPLLASLLIHDHVFGKGIAAPARHLLRQAVERHKARLQAEVTRIRLRWRYASLEDLKRGVAIAKNSGTQPRWIRVNKLKTNTDKILQTLLKDHRQVATLAVVSNTTNDEKWVYLDENIPNLLAISPRADLVKTDAYKKGEIVLQDKASCFPAEMLLGNDLHDSVGDIIDGCAAPGNKTTHLASVLSSAVESRGRRLYACERDLARSDILRKMIAMAGCDEVVTVLANQDFLSLDPHDERFSNVTHILLDPSCSGSGILGREDVPSLVLPHDPRNGKADETKSPSKTSLKRKRNGIKDDQPSVVTIQDEEGAPEETKEDSVHASRLEKLSNLQLRIIEHAFKFPAATRITYSTCSIHVEENESVVARALSTAIAQRCGWRLLERDEQVDGLRAWQIRGLDDGSHGLRDGDSRSRPLTKSELDACLRCVPGGPEGTMGFFACAFTRTSGADGIPSSPVETENSGDEADKDDEAWQGFSDHE